MYWTVSYDILLFSLSRLTQLQELNLNNNSKCRGAFSVIGEMVSLRKLSFDLNVVDVDGDDDSYYYGDVSDDDDDDDDDSRSLFDLSKWVKHKKIKSLQY